MTAGLNLKISAIRKVQASDDSVGGAVLTDITILTDQPASIFSASPTQASLEQGLEVDAGYTMTTQQSNIPQGLTIKERDLVEITFPSTSQYFGLRFRVIGIQPGKRRSKYAAQHYSLSRIRESRTQQ